MIRHVVLRHQRFNISMANQSKRDYTLRLKTASLCEVIFRAKQAILVLQLRILLRGKRNPVQVPKIDPADVESLELPFFQLQVSKDTVEEIIQGKTFTLNEDENILKRFEEAYSDIFFADIKQSDSSPDIRTVWEPDRLQHITTPIACILQNPDTQVSKVAGQFAKDAVLKWINKNPFLLGPHYISAMECGLRIPVFFYCLKSLDDLPLSEYLLILDTIYLHAWWISKRLSLYSSLGNHTICECVGMIFAGAVFRKTREGEQWLKKGFGLLKKELDHQVLDDGGPTEQSLSYHRFVLDLYWLVVAFLEENKLYDCSDIKPRLVQGENFLNAFQDKSGNFPSIGDSDDGYAVAPGIAPKRFKPDRIKHGIRVFKKSGYTVIKSENRVTFTFDHGPLGMSPLYNHGHADALSVTLSKDDKGILADPGTYRYNGEPEFRRYFKGTRAHNTVTIDGLDQAVQETGFIWSHPYKTVILNISEQKDELFVKAHHDGYTRLNTPVRHKRSILFYNKTTFLIKDTFSGEGIHDFELNYHLHPDAVCSKNHDWWLIDNQGAKVYIKLLDKPDFFFTKGREDPLFGWYSPSYGTIRKSGVLSCKKKGSANDISFITLICTESPFNS